MEENLEKEKEAKWYAVQTHSGSELAVKRALESLSQRSDKIVQVLVPTEDLIEVKKGEQVVVEKPLYSAYVFVKLVFDNTIWHKIQSLPKVGRFIGEAKKPAQLSEKDISQILEKVEKRAKPRPKIVFDNGEVVRIKEGSFANFNGYVESFDLASGILKLNVLIFGRNTPVEISYTQVERVQ